MRLVGKGSREYKHVIWKLWGVESREHNYSLESSIIKLVAAVPGHDLLQWLGELASSWSDWPRPTKVYPSASNSHMIAVR